MINAGTAITTTDTILCFSELLRLFKAFFFEMAATNLRSYLGFLLPMPKVHAAAEGQGAWGGFCANAPCALNHHIFQIYRPWTLP